MRFPVIRAVTLALTLAMLTSGSAAAAHHPPSGGTSAFVRVNQVGYPTGASKRAYLMASAVETGATFAVKNSSGTTVVSGPIGARLGSWSSGYPNVYAIDFTSLATAGTYTISVSGPIAATSPAFVVNAARRFTLARCETRCPTTRTPARRRQLHPLAATYRAGHLNDANAMTYSTPSYNAGSGRFSGDLSPLGVRVDASGGWWDAGRLPQFLQTESYTDGVLLSGVRDFPRRWHRARPAPTSPPRPSSAPSSCFACGTTRAGRSTTRSASARATGRPLSDHDIWRLPQADDTFGGTDPVDRYIRNRPVSARVRRAR